MSYAEKKRIGEIYRLKQPWAMELTYTNGLTVPVFLEQGAKFRYERVEGDQDIFISLRIVDQGAKLTLARDDSKQDLLIE